MVTMASSYPLRNQGVTCQGFSFQKSRMQKIAIPNESGPGTYINLHSKTDIMHRLSAGIRHMQISSELLSNQTFLKGLNFAPQTLENGQLLFQE